MSEIHNRQLLHLVFGGELKSVSSTEFRDPSALHIIGIYPNYKSAYDAWKAASQRTVDNALMRYFIVHMHRLLDPSSDAAQDAVASRIPGAQ
ncbi:MAG: DUF4170 domain-containing protein [Rhodomicrobium sp.]